MAVVQVTNLFQTKQRMLFPVCSFCIGTSDQYRVDPNCSSYSALVDKALCAFVCRTAEMTIWFDRIPNLCRVVPCRIIGFLVIKKLIVPESFSVERLSAHEVQLKAMQPKHATRSFQKETSFHRSARLKASNDLVCPRPQQRSMLPFAYAFLVGTEYLSNHRLNMTNPL